MDKILDDGVKGGEGDRDQVGVRGEEVYVEKLDENFKLSLLFS